MKSRILGAALTVVLAGCGGYDGSTPRDGVAPQDETSSTTAKVGETAKVGVPAKVGAAAKVGTPAEIGPPEGLELPAPVDAFYSWAQTAYAIMQFLIAHGDGAIEPPDLWSVHSNLQWLNGQMMALTQAVTDQRIRTDGQIAELQQQDVNEKYSAVQTSLEWAAEFPDKVELSVFQLQTTADALMANAGEVGGLYMMSDYPNADRFDPRLATPTFVSAVSAWIAVRSSWGMGKNRGKLHEYASHLEWVASSTANSVNCWSAQDIWERPGCGGRCEIYECVQWTDCHDAITARQYRPSEARTRLSNPPPQGACPAWSGFDWSATAQARASYGPDSYAAVAAEWHAYADM